MADKDAQGSGKGNARLIVGGIIVVLIGIFILQNRNDVPLTVLFFDITMPLWIGLLITVVLSLGAGFLIGRGRYKG